MNYLLFFAEGIKAYYDHKNIIRDRKTVVCAIVNDTLTTATIAATACGRADTFTAPQGRRIAEGRAVKGGKVLAVISLDPTRTIPEQLDEWSEEYFNADPVEEDVFGTNTEIVESV